MKLKNIIIGGLGLLSLTACNDYLDVEAPSKFQPEDIYNSVKDAGQALNGVYAEIMSSNCFGQAYTYSLILNSDVDFCTNSSENDETDTPKRYDQTAAGKTANNVWNDTYSAIESANNFIYYLQNSPMYMPTNDAYSTLTQYMGEAKVIRAMLYYELMCYWGDVPFSMLPTRVTNNFYPPITSRDVIARTIMEDLISIAPSMKQTPQIAEGVERISQEACWAMIARIGLQAAGYSLRHAAGDATTYGFMGKPSATDELWFLTQAHTYAKKVIEARTHNLQNSYQDVFLNECNFRVVNDDDPIFEIPFAKESSGYVGYRTGPKFESSGGATDYQWGECGGQQQINNLFRFSYLPGDTRKDATIGWWYYTFDGIPKINTNITVYNNKWSKLFNTTSAFSSITTGNTGINYPYIRYADVLLMFAEADVKLNGAVSNEALDAVQQVRNRAYIGSTVAAPQIFVLDPDEFLETILKERSWEFAGENSRWKDLVRNNLLSRELYFTFLRNIAVAGEMGGQGDAVVNDMVAMHDGIDYFGGTLGETYTQEEIDAAIPGDNAFGKTAGKDKEQIVPATLYYVYMKNPQKNSYFANHELPVLYLFNPEANNQKYKSDYNTAEKFFKYIRQTYPSSPVATYQPLGDFDDAAATLKYEMKSADFATKYWKDGNDYAENSVLYSMYGFIRADRNNKAIYQFNRNGVAVPFDISVDQSADLPVVRYLMPIPREAITRASGAYQNYYGY